MFAYIYTTLERAFFGLQIEGSYEKFEASEQLYGGVLLAHPNTNFELFQLADRKQSFFFG